MQPGKAFDEHFGLLAGEPAFKLGPVTAECRVLGTTLSFVFFPNYFKIEV